MDSFNDSRFAPREMESGGDRYRNLRTVAEDGSGRYLVGEDAANGERVVMVVARPVSVLTSPASTAHAESRLDQARAAAELRLPQLAPVRTLGRTAGGHPFAVSSLGDGQLLSEASTEGWLSAEGAVGLAIDVATTLAAAHASGIVHGSVSPRTIILAGDDTPASLHGFGISSPWMPADDPHPQDERVGSRPDAPDESADAWIELMARDDVRALARVLRALLEEASHTTPAQAAAVPPALVALLARAESESGLSAEVFANGLHSALASGTPRMDSDGEYGPIAAPPSRRRERRIAGVLMAIAALLALFVVLGRADRATEPTLEDQLAEANAPPGGGQEAIAGVPNGRSGGDVDAIAPPGRQGATSRAGTDSRVAQTPSSREESFGAVDRMPRGSDPSGSAEGSQSRAEGVQAAPPPTGRSQRTAEAGRLTTVPSGTAINLTAGERVCTNTHEPGDSFSATVSEPAGAGAIIPAGSRAVVQVSSVERAKGGGDPARLGLLVQQLVIDGRRYPVDASITRVQVDETRAASRESDAQKVIGGAIAGAILGQVLGKDTKSTVIGAATGAAAGTVIAMQTADRDGCIPAGGTIAIRLETPAQVASR